jgi:hypothetical protein
MNAFETAYNLSFESFGVKIAVHFNDPVGLSWIKGELPLILPGCFAIAEDQGPAQHTFHYLWNANGLDELYREGKLLIGPAERSVVQNQLNIHFRLTVAEFAVGHVFVHAGVVAWKGEAIVIPAKSFSGKSSLVLELVRQGALYYSDEYAIIDEQGLVAPFPKMLSLRTAGTREQTDHAIEQFGGRIGTTKIPIRLIVLTSYTAGALWEPTELSGGRAVIAVLRDTIPVRNDPQFTLAVLSRVTETATVIESSRGEAAAAAAEIMTYMRERLS